MSQLKGSRAAAGSLKNGDKSVQPVGLSRAGASNDSTAPNTRGGPTAKSRDAGQPAPDTDQGTPENNAKGIRYGMPMRALRTTPKWQ